MLPAIAKEVNAPISNIEKMVSFGGASDIHQMGEAGLARTFDTIKETTGLDLVNLINESMAVRQGNKEVVAAIDGTRPIERVHEI